MMKTTTDPYKLIDDALDSVLRSTDYCPPDPKTLNEMRKAMRKVMSDSYIAGSNDAMRVMQKNEK